MRNTTYFATIVALVANGSAQAQTAETCSVQQDALEALEKKYADEFTVIEEEGKDIEDDAPQGSRVNGTVTFQDAHMANFRESGNRSASSADQAATEQPANAQGAAS